MKDQVHIHDETGTAKDIVRVIRQAEDNYQVERLLISIEHDSPLSF